METLRSPYDSGGVGTGYFFPSASPSLIRSNCELEKSRPLLSQPPTVLHWFRLDSLRLNDNPAFHHAVSTGKRLKAIVILDPWFNSNNKSGPSVNVWRFLLESLQDLDSRLQKRPYYTRLNVYLGQPTLVLSGLFKKWNVSELTFQASQTSLESKRHDELIKLAATGHGVKATSFYAHTLYSPDDILCVNNGRFPQSYKELRHLLPLMGRPREPFPEPDPVLVLLRHNSPEDSEVEDPENRIPSLQDLGFGPGEALYTNSWVGGETEGLSRLSNFCSRRATQPSEPITWLISKDSLGPYIRFGCLSVCQLFSQLRQYASTSSKGQILFGELTKNLLMRDFAYMVGLTVPKFDTMKDNPLCIQLPWDENERFFHAWKGGRTGYPWIDAGMRQIVRDGWSHYSTRQSIAVFLTRGYLWVSWEKGLEFFQENMLDFELPVSTVCWMQSSCSGFFVDFIESYDPCYIGKQMDAEGHFIKLYVPELQDFPSDYIHMPWLAPLSVQKQAKCVIGKDYPKPIVDLCSQGELCCQRVKAILTALRELYGDNA